MKTETGGIEKIQRSRLLDVVIDQLRTLIINGDLKPGMPLLQVELSERLGVSRTPLRESLRVLEREGLVRIANGNRTVVVTDLSTDEVRELYEVRQALDGLAASLAASKGLSAQIDRKLLQLCDEMEDASLPSFEAARFARAHQQFHSLIAEASGNNLLKNNPLFQRQVLTRRMRRASEQGMDEPLREVLQGGNDSHREIYHAIQSGETRRAESAARAHIRRSMKTFLVTDFEEFDQA
jgi:DNA-binding GntR family transcriptional regulator